MALRPTLESLAPVLDLSIDSPGCCEIAAAREALMCPGVQVAIVGLDWGHDATQAGFELLAAAAAAGTAAGQVTTVLVAAHDADAARAYELEADDFLRAPVADDRLRLALLRARNAVLERALVRSAAELQRLLATAAAAATAAGTTPMSATTTTGGVASGAPPRESSSDADALTPLALAFSAALNPAAGAGDDRRSPAAGATEERHRARTISVREGRRTRFIPVVEIDWLEADGNYVVVHAAGATYRTRGTINGIEAGLDPRQFARIHRRVVVNMDRVRELTPLPGGDGLLRLGDGATLRLSRTYRARVR